MYNLNKQLIFMTYREKMKENSRRIHTCSSCEGLFNVYSMTFKGAQVRI